LSVEEGKYSSSTYGAYYALTLHYRKNGGGEDKFEIGFSDSEVARRVAKAFAHVATLAGAKSDPFN
jgi:hypothetical protein